MIVLAKDLIVKRNQMKKNYYDSRDKLLRYQITGQLTMTNILRSDESHSDKYHDNTELPPVDTVIQSNRASENSYKVKAIISTAFQTIKDFGTGFKETKIMLQIRENKFEMRPFTDDSNTYMFKNLAGFEEIETNINIMNTSITKTIKMKDLSNNSGKYNYKVDLGQTALGINGQISIEFKLMKPKEQMTLSKLQSLNITGFGNMKPATFNKNVSKKGSNQVDQAYYNNFISLKTSNRRMKTFEGCFTRAGILELKNTTKSKGLGSKTIGHAKKESKDIISNVDLASDFQNKPNGLFYTHLSQNKEANNFIDNQGQVLHDVDIALDFLDSTIRTKVRERLTVTRDIVVLYTKYLAQNIKN